MPATLRDQFLTQHEFVAAARRRLDANGWDYIIGGAETETTLRRNRQALDAIALRPRVLRDVSHIDCTATLFGKPARLPFDKPESGFVRGRQLVARTGAGLDSERTRVGNRKSKIPRYCSGNNKKWQAQKISFSAVGAGPCTCPGQPRRVAPTPTLRAVFPTNLISFLIPTGLLRLVFVFP